MLSASDWIEQLQLEPHREGGYYRRVYQSEDRPLVDTVDGQRFSMTSIYYMLTADKSIGCLHKNKSDIMHVFCGGAPLTYHLLQEDGSLQTKTLGPDPWAGNELQFVVPGGIWKATELIVENHADHDFGLLTEIVVPGFDYADMELADTKEMKSIFPQHIDFLERFCIES